MLDLLKIRGFKPFIIVMFLNAFVDLGHKILIQNTIFKAYDGQTQIILTAIVNALILLPYVFLFVPSGFLADKFPKNRVMQISAWFAVGITLLITFSYYMGWFWFGFAMTFLLATQSAFYAPAKYGYIKGLVGENRLTEGNGVAQAGTIIALLMGTFVFSILFDSQLSEFKFLEGNLDKSEVLQHIAPLGWILVALTLLELRATYAVPKQNKTDHSMQFDWKDFWQGGSAKRDLVLVWNHKTIWLTIIGLSVFWAVSQVIIATFPEFAKSQLNISATALVQGIVACAGIGIMIGSLIVGKISKNAIETGLIPIGALGFTITAFLIPVLPTPWLHALNFLVMGIMGGLFIIPLQALMQYHTDNQHLGRVIASSNFVKNLSMLVFLGMTILLAKLGLESTHFFLLLAFILLVGAGYTVYKLPQSMIRFVLSRLITSRYRIKPINFDNIPASGGVLLLGNHISWLDWAMVQIACPRHLHFVITKTYYNKWYLKRFLDMFGVVPIGTRASADSLKTVARLLNEGKAVCLFPEGTISRSGQLNEFKRGYELIAESSPEAEIVPFYLHGLWGSRFSHSGHILNENSKKGWKRDVIVAFGKPLAITTPHDQLKQSITELSLTSWQQYAQDLESIPEAWLHNTKQHLSQDLVCESNGQCLTAHKFMTAVFCFADEIRDRSPEQNIGLLLPSTIAGSITNMAVLSLGKTIVNLNYTASSQALQAAIELAEIRSIYTSKKFISKLQGRGIDIAANLPHTRLIYLEDLKPQISQFKLAWTAAVTFILPSFILRSLYIKTTDCHDTAAILFSSGSEGTPKGIELSHLNLAANARQVADVLNPDAQDKMVASLPTFHAFGLLATTLMPLSEGIPFVCHPDPTDVVNIAKGVARFKATYLFGTSTFLRMFAKNRKVHPLMLESLRLTIAGAEKLKPEVREAYQFKFNQNVLEGYGATETSPVASVNLPDNLSTSDWKVQTGNILGTVGQPLPGTSFRIVDPVTLENLATGEDGLILIAGPQVMKGYLKRPEKTAEAIVELDGFRWYKTGDKGHLNNDGFLIIVDRYSRFAKIGGEMVSLSAVEQHVLDVLNDETIELLAVNLPDDKKGEKIVLMTTHEINQAELKQTLIAHDVNPLMLPSQTIVVDEIPKLGSGKTDFAAAKRLLSS